LFEAGKPLLREATPMLRFELSLTWNGGIAILKNVESMLPRILERRPTLTRKDKAMIFLKSLSDAS
jgi:hypothetical protein